MAVEANKQTDEAEITRVIERGVEAIRDKHIEGVMSLYAPEVVSFDIVPKLALPGNRGIQESLGSGLLVVPGSDRL